MTDKDILAVRWLCAMRLWPYVNKEDDTVP